MPAKKEEELKFHKKVKVLSKLYESGCKTEKELLDLSIESILQIEGITIQDIAMITDLKKSVKSHHLYSYLAGGVEPQRWNSSPEAVQERKEPS